MTQAARALGAGLAILALLAACGGVERPKEPARSTSPPPSSSPSPAAPSQGPEYVALGDSFTAGGPIGALQDQGLFCQRSSRNYPSVVSTTLDLPLTDVSCGGATSTSLLESVRDAPPQVDAITPRTRVVTVGVGGNDFGLYGTLLLTCPDISKPGARGAPCKNRLGSQVASTVPSIGDTVGRVLAAVNRKAPGAEVLLVGYPRLMPSSGTCAAAPYAAGDIAWIASMESDLSATMAAAARAHDVTYVPMYRRSKGHDLCSGEAAWVNGLDPPNGGGLVLHPNAAGEQAIAQAVVKALGTVGVTPPGG
jgi:lysophospholipase L1-like esterase